MKTTTLAWTSLILAVLALLNAGDLQGQTALLGVDNRNPRWLRAGGDGKAIVLTGSHTWSVFQDYRSENFGFETDFLNPVILGNGHNFFRGWIWEDDFYKPHVYPKPETPGAKFNLGAVEVDLFGSLNGTDGRIRERLNKARNNGVYASVMLFQGWSTGRFADLRIPNPWEEPGDPTIPHHPYHVGLNSNNVDGNFLLGPDGRETQEALGTPASTAVLNKQLPYVRRVVNRLEGFDNIIWEVSNETHFSSGSVAWQNRIAQEIRNRDPQNRPILISCLNAPDTNGPRASLETMLNMDAELIAPCRDRSVKLDILSADPPHATGEKVLIADSDHLGAIDFVDKNGNIRPGTDMWAWKYFLRGYHPIYLDLGFDLPWWRAVGNECDEWCQSDQDQVATRNTVRKTLGAIKFVSRKVKLQQLVPQRKGDSWPVSWNGSGNVFALYSSKRAEKADVKRDPLSAKGREYLVWVKAGRTAHVCGLKSRKYKFWWRDVKSGASGTKQIRQALTEDFDCQDFSNTNTDNRVLHLRWGPKPKPPDVSPTDSDSFFFDSTDPTIEDGETFAWDFGDGATATGQTASHTFAAGVWTVTLTVTDGDGDSDFVTTVVAVDAAPVITLHPVSVTVEYGQPASFSMVATASPTPTYRWQKLVGGNWVNLADGGGLSGTVSSTLAITSASLTDAGQYRCVVSNAFGTDFSSPATLTVQGQAPQITLHPQPATAKIDATVTFSCAATGNPAPIFGWFKDGVAVVDDGRITGAATSTMTILDVDRDDRGSYHCRATNGIGSADSATATLKVTTVGSLTLEQLILLILN